MGLSINVKRRDRFAETSTWRRDPLAARRIRQDDAD